MKLQIITLEPEDDQVSTRDKLAWSKASRAVLVWPRRGRILTHRLDLALLQRQASRLRIEIGLVTYDPEVIGHAEALGIPVFESPDRLPEAVWQRAKPETPLPSPPRIPLGELPDRSTRQAFRQTSLLKLNPAGRGIAFGAAVTALLVLAATLGPHAEIRLSPEREIQRGEFKVYLDPEIDVPTADGRIPAQVLTLQISGESRMPTSGAALVPKISAAGTVVFTNLTPEPVTIPAGTGLRASASGVRFLVLEAVELPSGVGSTVGADIVAAEPGSSGNIPKGAIDSVEGQVGFLVSAANPEPTRGGVSESSPAVANADQTRLKIDLRRELLQSARERLASGLSADQVLAQSSLTLIETLSEQFDQQIGDPAVSLGLAMELEVQGLAYRLSDLETAAGDFLAAELPEHYLPVPDTIRLTDLTDPGSIAESEPVALTYRAQQHIVRDIDFAELRRKIRGLRSDRAAERLTGSLDLTRLPRISLSPPWFPWLPWLPLRIDIRWAWEGS